MILNWWESRTSLDLKLKAPFFMQRTGLCFLIKNLVANKIFCGIIFSETDVGG